MSGASASPFIDIDVTGVYTGAIFDVALGAAATNNVINIDLDAGLAATALRIDSGAGTRTQQVIELIFEGDGTGAGGTLFDIDVNSSGATSNPLIDITLATGVYAGNIFDVVFGNASASTGDAFKVTTGTNLAGSALVIDATEAATRTDDLVKIDSADAGSSMVFDINLSGIHTGNVLDITYATAAGTGNDIDLNMGTNVAGMAISINSSATGVSDEGSAIDIVHDGVLVAGADIVSIAATGAVSSTLAVTGATTLSSTLSYRELTETVTATNVITAAESGKTFFLDAVGGFTS